MTRRLRLTLAVSAAGHLVHNVEEFGLTLPAAGHGIVPLGVSALLMWAARSPTPRMLGAAALWGLTVVVIGGGSVLPWPFLPFVPAQTPGHYAAHAVYALLQLPLLIVVRQAWRTPEAPVASGRPQP